MAHRGPFVAEPHRKEVLGQGTAMKGPTNEYPLCLHVTTSSKAQIDGDHETLRVLLPKLFPVGKIGEDLVKESLEITDVL